MKELLIKAENLSKRYLLNQKSMSINEFIRSIFVSQKRNESDALWALHDVSFELRKGESLGVIGQNGAGKSTLLQLLAGVTAPTSGHLTINGTVASLLDIGSGFHPELTGRENIHYNAKILGVNENEVTERFDEIVAFSGIGQKFIDTPVKYYSSGMFLRLAFAQATHLDRDIMLFDEVLAVGDKEFRQKCKDRVIALNQQGKSFVVVSHSLGELSEWIDTVLLLENGKVKGKGPLLEVMKMENSTNERTQKVSTPHPLEHEVFENHFIDIHQLTITNPLEQTATLYRDKPVLLELEYEELGHINEDVAISLVVIDPFDTRLFAINTLHWNDSVRKGKKKITWEIPANTFYPTQYRIMLNVWVSEEMKYKDTSFATLDIQGHEPPINGTEYYIPLKIASDFNLEYLNE